MIDPDESRPLELREEAMKFDFEQKVKELDIDPKLLPLVSEDLEHYQNVLRERLDFADREKITEAVVYMLELHKDQADRPDGNPYIRHPLEVSRTVVEDFEIHDIDHILASLLHDSVEDQPMKLAAEALRAKYGDMAFDSAFEQSHGQEIKQLALAKIADKYGHRVSTIIDHLTNPDFDELAKKDTNPDDPAKFQARKDELYKEHVEQAIGDPDVFVVKLADFLHNFTNLAGLEDSSQKQKLKQKYIPVARVFIEQLSRNDEQVNIKNKEVIQHRLAEAIKTLD